MSTPELFARFSVAAAGGLVLLVVLWALMELSLDPPKQTFRCECCDEELPTSERFLDEASPDVIWCKACVEADEDLADALSDDEPEAA